MKDAENKGKVFVIQEVSKFNVISAKEYGELIPIFEEGKQIMLSPGPAIRKAKMVLKDFNDNDYLLLIGDPSMIGLACAIAAHSNRGKFNVLKYDRRTYTYYPIQIDLNERNNYERDS
jgi:hypothetical protein|tara:strand:- start:62 stop:415 length:354 start_codon:yes stop_codon:yes gene_type:complete